MTLPRLMLALLPGDFRREYGDDMLATFSAARDEPRGTWASVRFWLRELAGWCALAVRLSAAREAAPDADDTGRALTTLIGGRRGAWAALLAGATGGLVLWIGGELVASHGIYWRAAQPVAATAMALLGGTVGWELAGMRSGRQRLRAGAVLLTLLLATLPAFRLVDHFYLTRAAGRGEVAFSLPGIQLSSVRLQPGQTVPRVSMHAGFQATRLHGGSDGVRLLTIWERRPDAPPYLLLGVLLLLASTLAGHSARKRLADS